MKKRAKVYLIPYVLFAALGRLTADAAVEMEAATGHQIHKEACAQKGRGRRKNGAT